MKTKKKKRKRKSKVSKQGKKRYARLQEAFKTGSHAEALSAALEFTSDF